MRKSDLRLMVGQAKKYFKNIEVLERVQKELSLFQDLPIQDPELYDLLQNPFIPFGTRKKALVKALKGMHPITVGILILLARYRGLQQIPELLRFLQDISYEKEGKIQVFVQGPEPLPKPLEEKLFQKLRQATGRKPVFIFRRDESLLGGFFLKAPGYQLDASMRGLIKTLKAGGLNGT